LDLDQEELMTIAKELMEKPTQRLVCGVVSLLYYLEMGLQNEKALEACQAGAAVAWTRSPP